MNKRIPTLLAILIILLVIFAIIIVAFLLCPKEDETSGTELDIVSTTTRTETDYGEDASTEGWQTYKNEEYGFELKYPKNWAFLYDIDHVVDWKSDEEIKNCCNNCSFAIHVYNKEDNLSLSEWAHKQFDVPGEENVVNEMMVNNLNVIKHEDNDYRYGNLGTRILFQKDKTIVSIFTSFELCRSTDVFNQILSTFRFIEPVGTCVDNCGNGICEEVVCLAIGCPCAETKENCPQDCGTETEPETVQLEIKDFMTDKKTYTSNEELKASLTVSSSGEIKGVTVKLTGIKPYNYAYINSSQTVDLNSGENEIIFTTTTPHCTAGCGGVYPGPYDLNAEIFINENLVASSTVSINLTNE